MRLSMRVWDLPIRLFHAAVILLLIGGALTIRSHHPRWHALDGEVLLALLLWRVIWGFVGSQTARLAAFAVPPRAPRGVDDSFGHAAAGGWLVLYLLALLLVLTISGLIATAQSWHRAAAWMVLAGIVLHVVWLAIGRPGDNPVRAIITGKRRLPAALRAPRMASPALAALILACAGGGVLALLNFLGR